MKKQVIAIVVLSAATHYATAQTAVNIYGIVDLGLVRESGGASGAATKVTSGVGLGSRIGLRGTENLGGGLSANFLLESGFQADTGALGQGGLLFGRQAYAGISGTFGSLTLGRQYTPHFTTLAAFADPFGTGYAGNASNLMAFTGGRANNSIKYITPSAAGLTGELLVGLGEVAGDHSAGRAVGAAVSYAHGALNVRIAHHNRDNDTATMRGTTNAKNTLLGLNYDFRPIKAFVAYGVNKGPNSSPVPVANAYGSAIPPQSSIDSRDILLGFIAPMGIGRIIASYIHKDDRTTFDQDARQLGLAYVHPLSKRTELYTSYGNIDNDNGAGYTVGSAIETGSGNKAISLGVRHTF